MYSSDNLGFSSSSRKLRWGFVEAGEALAAHRARPINQNASLLLWITSNTLQLCSVDHADIEEGARQAYRHIAGLYEEGSSEAWLSQRRSVISLDLAQEFASQADAYKVNGMRPKLRIESIDARVLYAIWLPEDMSVDFRLSDYPDATTPWGRMSRWVGWNAAKLRTMTKFMRQVCIEQAIAHPFEDHACTFDSTLSRHRAELPPHPYPSRHRFPLTPFSSRFPPPSSVNRCILGSTPSDEYFSNRDARQIWNQNEGETTCIHLLVHVTGFEDCQLVQEGEGGEGRAAEAQPFDHLLLFETKVHWHNLRRWDQ